MSITTKSAARRAATRAWPTNSAAPAQRAPRRLPPWWADHHAVRVMVAMLAAPAAVLLAGGGTAAACALLAIALVATPLDGRCRLRPSALDETPSIAVVGVVGVAVVALLGLPSGAATEAAVGLVLIIIGYVVLSVAGRGLGYIVIDRARRRHHLLRPAVVVGAGAVGQQLAAHLAAHPEYGLEPVGMLDSGRLVPVRGPSAGVLGTVADLPEVIRRYSVATVFLAFPAVSDERLLEAVRASERADCEIYVVPRLFELGGGAGPSVDHVWGVPCLRIRRAHRHPSWLFKRAFDVVFAGLALVLLSPVLALIALAVRFEVGSPVLFRQPRLTTDGRVFTIVKFRTLRPAEPVAVAAPGDPDRVAPADPRRMGPVGRFLRRSSGDELPQLWNVLRGDMSIVGPRPEQPTLARRLSYTHRHYDARLRVPAGVTGLAQVHDLRGGTSIDERIRFDNLYADTWSPWQDVKVVLRTVGSVVGMRGE